MSTPWNKSVNQRDQADKLALEAAVLSFTKGGRVFGNDAADTDHLFVLVAYVVEQMKDYIKSVTPDQLPLGVLLELEYTQDGFGLRLVIPPESLNVKQAD